MENLIIYAASYANSAHMGQQRKWTKRPFIEHPARVAANTCLQHNVGEHEIAAAWLHDVVEDCEQYTIRVLHADGFPFETLQLVSELTNTSSSLHQLGRSVRKYIDHNRLANVSVWAKRIKMIDIIDNIRDMAGAPESFASLFVAEKLSLLKQIGHVSNTLYDEALAAVEEAGFKRDHCDKRTELTLNKLKVTNAKVSQNSEPVPPGPSEQ